jgi:endonuclease III
MKRSLSEIIAILESHYGRPKPPKVTDPFHLILWESIGYLVDDDRREIAFDALRNQIGLKPTDLLAGPMEKLVSVTKLGGIHPELRAARLKEIAQITLNDFDGDLNNALKLPLRKAIRELKKFPSIGDPGAEKILLFTRTYPVLALESNGLRVLLRLGFGQEHKNYSKSYASVREVLKDQLGNDYDFLIRANQLLRQHGKELCKTNAPLCPSCPLRTTCHYHSFVERERLMIGTNIEFPAA